MYTDEDIYFEMDMLEGQYLAVKYIVSYLKQQLKTQQYTDVDASAIKKQIQEYQRDLMLIRDEMYQTQQLL